MLPKHGICNYSGELNCRQITWSVDLLKKSNSISNEVLLTVLLVTALTLAAWGAFDYSRTLLEAEKDLHYGLARQTERLSHSIVYPTWNLDQDEIERSIDNELKNVNTLAIILRKEDGGIIAGKIKKDNNKASNYRDSEAERHVLESSFAEHSLPVMKNKIVIGNLSVYYADKETKLRIRKDLYYMILQLISLSIIISFTIYFILKLRIIKPLNQLENSVRKISTENLAPQISVKRYDEIGKLAESFVQMGKTLQLSFSKQETLTDEIRKREEQFRAIVSNVPGAIYRISGDRQQTVLYVSEHIESFSGTPAYALMGKSMANFRQMVVESDLSALDDAIQYAITQRLPYDVKYRIADQQGSIHWIHEIGQCSTLDCSWLLDGVMVDDTELHEKDSLLIQSQKMETVGVLAGGIAHDFNNILSGIMGAVSMLKIKLAGLSETSHVSVAKYVSMIERSSLRAAEMTTQLMSLAKPQDLKLVPVDLNSSIQHVIQICQNTLDKSVSILEELPGDGAMVNADIVQIEQVLLNLCVNAAHSMTIMRPPERLWGGDLHIILRKLHADRTFCMSHPNAKEMDYWELTIKDSGVGVEEKNLSNIFTPFFTTKEKGAGSGLGLSMAYTIIAQHNGFIAVHSEPGEGSEFKVYLPVLAGAARLHGDAPCGVELPRGTGTILVVDDEVMLRDSAAEILIQCGFRVIFAQNGEEAVQQIEAHGKEIQLVLLDMVMPVLSGRDAFFRIKKIMPNLRVLLSSGNRQDERVQELLAAGVDDFIPKPYSLQELAGKVHELTESNRILIALGE